MTEIQCSCMRMHEVPDKPSDFEIECTCGCTLKGWYPTSLNQGDNLNLRKKETHEQN